MRITVAGKGGSGKTTIAGVLARSLGRRLGNVLAIDADSNPNLALTLGLSKEQAGRIPALPRDLLEQYTDSEGKTRLRLALPIEEVIAKFGVDAPDGVRLLVGGKVDHAGAG